MDHPSKDSFFHRLSNLLWVVIVVATVTLAIYVSAGRLAMALVDDRQGAILDALNARLPFTVAASGVSGSWASFSPQIVLHDLRITFPGEPHQPIELAEGRITLDVWRMLLSGRLHSRDLILSNLHLRARLTDDGRLQVSGLEGAGRAGLEWLQTFLLNGEHIELSASLIELELPDGSQRVLRLDLDLRREGGRRQLDGQLLDEDGSRVRVLANGVGNPFRLETFAGDLYLDASDVDLQSLQGSLLSPLPLTFDAGSLGLELWLSWRNGEPSIEGHVEATDLLIEPVAGDWKMPVERIAFDASLVQRRDLWTLYAADLHWVKHGHELVVPRMQLRLRGDSVRLRSERVSLAQLNRALVELETTPAQLKHTFRVLQPGGELQSLQFSIEDYRRPAEEWTLAANFREVALDSWKGAPGTSGAAGYLSLGNGGGQAVVDARDVLLEFPSVYREPLRYDELFGTVDINWFDDAVVLSSGLISGRGVEGDVRALFGLNIPLQSSEVGLEMDLIAGIRDTHVNSRNKYLPYVLAPSLFDWLRGSIADGEVDEAGFIWRGSLRRGQAAARTVQLYLDVTDTTLAYDAAWPAVESLDGLVLVDDTDVSVWSEDAAVYQTAVSRLSAEAWMAADRQLRLQISAAMRGPGGDMAQLIRESPLADTTRNVFRAWSFDGAVESQLRLALNLSGEGERPRVSVRSEIEDGELAISPGNLRLSGLAGVIDFSTERGFASAGLQARLWDEPVSLSLGSAPGTSGAGAYDLASMVTRIGFSGDVGMADLTRWLDLPPRSLATGKTAVSGEVLVKPGAAVEIRAFSRLAGVDLRLPAPLGGDDRGPLTVSLAVEEGVSTLDLALGDSASLRAALADARLVSAALGFGESPAPLQDERLLVSGRLPTVDVAEWQQFLGALMPAPGAATAGVADSGVAAPSLGLRPALDKLAIGTLELWGRTIEDVVLSAERTETQWRIAATTDWIDADFSLADAGTGSHLSIERLDIAALKRLQGEQAGSAAAPPQLPEITVDARNLAYGERQLGHLGFSVRSERDAMVIGGVTGELAGLRLPDGETNRLVWRGGEAPMSALSARLQFDDFGDTLQAFDYQRIVETREGAVDVTLQWPGGPQQFTLGQAEGLVRIEAGEGRFLDAPPAASGALRVVSIVNLAEIVSRLSLTHMFESGIPFRSIVGDVALHSGTLEVAGLEVRGVSSGFQFSGLSTIAERDLDGELVVTLPVANNLPWVAALAAGLPVAAGVFVVSRVFEKQFNQLSSAVYEVSGSWDDPAVDFSRIFDVEQQPARVGDAGMKPVETVEPARAQLQDPLVNPPAPDGGR